MSLKEFKLAYGHGTQSVMLPEEHISDVLEGVPTPACDVKEATIECMRHPIGAEPLHDLVKKGDKVCLVVADITRAWNRASEFTVHVVNELNDAGIPERLGECTHDGRRCVECRQRRIAHALHEVFIPLFAAGVMAQQFVQLPHLREEFPVGLSLREVVVRSGRL